MANKFLALQGDIFDISKLDLIGGPTITEDGICQCSSGNYAAFVNLDFSLASTVTIKFKTKVKFTGAAYTGQNWWMLNASATRLGTEASGTQIKLLNSANKSGGQTGLSLSDGDIVESVTHITPTGTFVKCCINGTQNFSFTTALTTDDIRSATQIITGNSTYTSIGDIYLTNFKLYIDGILTKSPTKPTYLLERRKEGYDPSKFTVVGSPTITEDGVASGFSNAFASYVSVNGLNAKDLKDKSWKIKAFVIVPNGFGKIVPIFNIGRVYGMFGTVIVGQSYVRFAARTGTMSDTNNEGGKITINKQVNVTHIAVELEYNLNTGTYKLIAYDTQNNIKLGEGSWTAPIESRTNTQLVGINEGGEIVLGAVRDSNTYYEITHIIDLPSISITVDGKEGFTGAKEQFYMLRR